MKFFKLKNGFSRLEEIGKFPQAASLKVTGDIYNLIDNPKIYARNIDFHWELPEPIVMPEANLTTLLSVAPIPETLFLVLKDYFLTFLDAFKIGEYSSWPIPVHYKEKIVKDYCIFHLSYPSDIMIVDYAKSKFLIGKIGDWKNPSVRQTVKVEDHENYLCLMDVLGESTDNSEIRCDKLVFDFSRIENDLVRITDVPFASGYYASERLKNSIEKQSYTGFEFVDIEEYDNRILVVSDITA